jgi:hypothetical protein
MASAPSKTTTVKTVNNKTGVTTSVSKSTSGGSSTVTKTTTIGTPAKTTTAATVSTPATLPGAVLGSQWIAGPNQGAWTLCAPVAVANTLLGATGLEAGNGEIERLYAAAGGHGDSGVLIPAVLAAVKRDGLAGCRLKSWRTAALDDADLLWLLLPDHSTHAVAFAGMQAVTWGTEIPLAELDARILGAWSLTWHGQEVPRG